MKPPLFEYDEPTTIGETVGLLASHENTKILAGGQSLMPMMNYRYLSPDRIVDINHVLGLSDLTFSADTIHIGGMTRHRALELSPEIKVRLPLMHEAMPHIGHRQTRNRGTLGGSLAHADPSAELATVAFAFDATVELESKRGKRRVPVEQFITGFMTTDLAADELLTGVTVPPWPPGHGYAFVEFARRRGDFALGSAAVMLVLDAERRVNRASLTVAGVGPCPVRLREAERLLVGQPVNRASIQSIFGFAEKLEATTDIHASAEYRRHLAQALLGRALITAAGRAGVAAHA